MRDAKFPQLLHTWFLIHFFVDWLFGLPLLLFPQHVMNLLGFQTAETISVRFVGAALLAIGGVSPLARNEKAPTFKSLLTLKVIWSAACIFASIISLFNSAPPVTWIILVIFILFFIIWLYYIIKINPLIS